jgi:hypothetical protein
MSSRGQRKQGYIAPRLKILLQKLYRRRHELFDHFVNIYIYIYIYLSIQVLPNKKYYENPNNKITDPHPLKVQLYK